MCVAVIITMDGTSGGGVAQGSHLAQNKDASLGQWMVVIEVVVGVV